MKTKIAVLLTEYSRDVHLTDKTKEQKVHLIAGYIDALKDLQLVTDPEMIDLFGVNA